MYIGQKLKRILNWNNIPWEIGKYPPNSLNWIIRQNTKFPLSRLDILTFILSTSSLSAEEECQVRQDCLYKLCNPLLVAALWSRQINSDNYVCLQCPMAAYTLRAEQFIPCISILQWCSPVVNIYPWPCTAPSLSSSLQNSYSAGSRAETAGWAGHIRRRKVVTHPEILQGGFISGWMLKQFYLFRNEHGYSRIHPLNNSPHESFYIGLKWTFEAVWGAG